MLMVHKHGHGARELRLHIFFKFKIKDVNYVKKVKFCLLVTTSMFSFAFARNWLGRTMGKKTIYGDGLIPSEPK